MLNNVSFNQLYNLEQSKYQSNTNLTSNSFGSVFSDALSLDTDPISADLEAGLLTTPAGTSEYFLNMFKNEGSSGMLQLFFAMLGLSSSGEGLSSMASGTSQYSYMQNAINGYSTGIVNNDNSGAIPQAASKAVNPFVTSSASNRSAGLYRKVIDQFNVETNPRYEVNKKGRGDTYCNIFMWDVTRAMGAEIPHYVDADTREPRYYPDVKGARELNANSIYEWLAEKGAQYGWKEVTPEVAQQLANQGKPVVTAKRNYSGKGHVQVVCPSYEGGYNPTTGVTVAQAGSKLTNYATLSSLYRGSVPQFKYYAHT